MDDFTPQIDELARQLLEVQHSIAALHRDLGANPDYEGKRKAELAELMRQRDELTRDLGARAGAWVRSGGQIELRRVAAPFEEGGAPASSSQATGESPAAPPLDTAALANSLVPAWAEHQSSAMPAARLDFSSLPALRSLLEAPGEPLPIGS